MSQGWLPILAVGIVLCLAAYAGLLLWRLYLQQKQHLKRLKAHSALQLVQQEATIQSIRLVASACQSSRCEPAEAAIRLIKLLRTLPQADATRLQQHYPHLHALYDKIGAQPILDERKKLSKQVRKRFDVERVKWERKFGPLLEKELALLVQLNANQIGYFQKIRC